MLVERASRYVHLLGEVQSPGRYEMHGPTSLVHAMSLSGGWKPKANLQQVVVFRATEDGRVLATQVDLQRSLAAQQTGPADAIWLGDGDAVVVPSERIETAEFADPVLTRRVFGLLPLARPMRFWRLGTLDD